MTGHGMGEESFSPGDYVGFAVIGGSGAYDLARDTLGGHREEESVELVTPFGRSARIDFFRPDPGAGCFAFMSRHGLHGYHTLAADVNYRANIWALKLIGTERIFAWSGPGAIDERLLPGDYVLPHDLIDFTRQRESSFLRGTGLGFIRQNPLFCQDMRSVLEVSLRLPGHPVHESAVYAVTEGPRLETAAEIRMLHTLGADLVGMTLAPECFLARELEICYHPACYVTNRAEGIGELPYHEGELFEGMLEPERKPLVEQAVRGFSVVVRDAASRFSAMTAARECPCSRAMSRYRRAGRIGDDWRDWINPR